MPPLKGNIDYFFYFFSTTAGSGLHWFVLCRREENLYEIFDSLGSSKSTVQKVLSGVVGQCDFNETSVQPKSSEACGQFCIFFAIQRYFNDDLEFGELLNEDFAENLELNKKKVLSFIQKLTTF